LQGALIVFSRPPASWIDGAKEKRIMSSTASQPQSARWLSENGPKELERLFRAIVFHPYAPILLADDDGHYQEATSGATKLLGRNREEILGRKLDDFAEPSVKPLISDRWRTFLEEGAQDGTVQLIGPDGAPREVEYSAKGNILPVRHLMVLRDKTSDSDADKDRLPIEVPRGCRIMRCSCWI
jgi:PAS domain S-box-containing protein